MSGNGDACQRIPLLSRPVRGLFRDLHRILSLSCARGSVVMRRSARCFISSVCKCAARSRPICQLSISDACSSFTRLRGTSRMWRQVPRPHELLGNVFEITSRFADTSCPRRWAFSCHTQILDPRLRGHDEITHSNSIREVVSGAFVRPLNRLKHALSFQIGVGSSRPVGGIPSPHCCFRSSDCSTRLHD